MIRHLEKQKISPALFKEVQEFRKKWPVEGESAARIPSPAQVYYGKEIWEQALAALLCGKNLLLAGQKATGKNILAENLAAVFGRPVWNISFHINMDASALIGSDTFADGAVTFRPGPVSLCARMGGFGILDEINMARNEAMAVLHSALDYRRVIDVPGYDRIPLHPASRFIATMNYGYAGTKELNEALLSRFVVLHMPVISRENLEKLLNEAFPALRPSLAGQFAALFEELQRKCENGEISGRALDLRGLLDAVGLMQKGLSPHGALCMGIANKSFDPYEQELIRDVIRSRISGRLPFQEIFEENHYEK